MADFEFFLNDGLARTDHNCVAQEAFINRAEDIIADGGKIPGTFVAGIKRAGEISQLPST